MNRNTSPRLKNKSKSPLIHSPTKSLSPVKQTSKKKNQQNTQISLKMQKNRERLCNTLDTYTLLIRSNNPIRCLQHNSNISIYCQTQQKLLCTNCVFAKHQHKFHKVIPIDKAYDKLSRDIEIMQRQIERQVQGIDEVYTKIYKNYQNQQKDANQILDQLQKNYQASRNLLDQCFVQAKKKIVHSLQEIRLKHETVLLELKFLKDVYKDQYKNVSPSTNENYLLYQHCMCSTIVTKDKFYGNKWSAPIKQIQNMGDEELNKIHFILSTLTKYLEHQKK